MSKAKKPSTRTARKKKEKIVYASKEELTPDYTEEDFRVFIESQITKPAKMTKETYTRLTPSYWRVTFWGEVDPTNIFSGEKILTSHFIRIDIDSIGRLKYNDVTEGNRL